MRQTSEICLGLVVLTGLCFLLSGYRWYCVAQENQRDLRVSFQEAPAWMLEALPGIGPVSSAKIIDARAAGAGLNEIDWPKRSQPFIKHVFKSEKK